MFIYSSLKSSLLKNNARLSRSGFFAGMIILAIFYYLLEHAFNFIKVFFILSSDSKSGESLFKIKMVYIALLLTYLYLKTVIFATKATIASGRLNDIGNSKKRARKLLIWAAYTFCFINYLQYVFFETLGISFSQADKSVAVGLELTVNLVLFLMLAFLPSFNGENIFGEPERTRDESDA